VTSLHGARGVGGVLAIMIIALVTLIMRGGYGRVLVLAQGLGVNPQTPLSLLAWLLG
jgi:hypothetical protein